MVEKKKRPSLPSSSSSGSHDGGGGGGRGIRARLVLEDGTEFLGWSFGAAESVAGEVGEDALLLMCVSCFTCTYRSIALYRGTDN